MGLYVLFDLTGNETQKFSYGRFTSRLTKGDILNIETTLDLSLDSVTTAKTRLRAERCGVARVLHYRQGSELGDTIRSSPSQHNEHWSCAMA